MRPMTSLAAMKRMAVLPMLINDQTPLATTTIKIMANAGNVLEILWGDGLTTTVVCNGVLNTYTHDYAATGTYTIGIRGNYKAITQWQSFSHLFLSGDIKAFAPLTSLTQLYLSSTSVSGDIANLAPLTSLTILYLGSTSVDTYTTPTALPAWAGCNIQILNLGLDQTEVDGFLNDLADGCGAGGALYIAGTNAARTAASDAAKATLLAAGWTVSVNE